MLYALRPYQSSALATLRAKAAAGVNRLLLVAPTGSGKTVCAASLIESATAKGSRILFLAHRLELIEQCSRKLDEIGVDHGIIKASHPRSKPGLPVQVASVQTLVRRQKPAADLIIVDEAHRCLAASYGKILECYPAAKVLGLTATPWRTDGRGLGKIYEDIVVTASISELATSGYLLVPRVYAPKRPNLRGVKTRSGDYAQDELALRMDRPQLIGDIVKHWQGLAGGRRTAVFASSVQHSRHIAEMFVAAGIRAEHVDGAMREQDRAGVLSRLASGETTVVCNCDIITEGYDLPVLACAVLARPTQSSCKYRQMIGRIMRPAPGKEDCIVLDHAGCVHGHGFVEDAVVYTLDDTQKKQAKPAAVKVCRSCFAVMPAVASRCPACGEVQKDHRVASERGGPEEVDGELSALRPEDRPTCEECGSNNTRTFTGGGMGGFRIGVKCLACDHTQFENDGAATRKATPEARQKEWERLADIGKRKGYKPGWAAYRYKAIFGRWPPKQNKEVNDD